MVFGIGKKRESWTSRPFSMILPDNVKLFSKKNRGILDKASQDYSSRLIEGHKSPSLNSSKSTVGSISNRTSADEPITPDTPTSPATTKFEERRKQASNFGIYTAVPTTQTSSYTPNKQTNAPFLTLNIDNERSMQELSDQIGDLQVSPVTQTQTIPKRTKSLKRDTPVDLVDIPVNLKRELTTDTIKQPLTPTTHAKNESLHFGEESLFGESSETLLIYRKLGEQSTQEECLSDITSEPEDSRKLVLNNGKIRVLVDHGVYIFDSTADMDLKDFSLPANESFNPFVSS